MIGILRDTLGAYLDQHEPGMEGLIFTRPQGGKGKGALSGRPLDVAKYNARWHELVRVAGLPDISPHSARHTCNTILTELKVPVDVRIQILGQAGERVNTQVYTHTSDSRVREAMIELDQAMRWR